MTSDDKIELLRKMKEEVSQGGGPERIARQRAKGKKTAREKALEGLELARMINDNKSIDEMIDHLKRDRLERTLRTDCSCPSHDRKN